MIRKHLVKQKSLKWQLSLSVIFLVSFIWCNKYSPNATFYTLRFFPNVPPRTGTPSVSVGSGHSFISDCREHVNRILLNDQNVLTCNMNTCIYANGDDKNEGDQSGDKAEESQAAPQDSQEPKQEVSEEEKIEKPEEQVQQSESRIQTYDEYQQLRDSNRPFDSHYNTQGSGFRRSTSNRQKINLLFILVALSIIIFGTKIISMIAAH